MDLACVADGTATCPWKWTNFLYLLDAKSGDALTFSSSTSGGKVAISDLTQQIKKMRSTRPAAMPIVELESVQMSTAYGDRLRPAFKIVGWQNRAAADEEPPQLEPEYREHEEVEF
jgi:hypothetical protein